VLNDEIQVLDLRYQKDPWGRRRITMTGTAAVVPAADTQFVSRTEMCRASCNRSITLCSTGSVQ
jgi:hypothetical protein